MNKVIQKRFNILLIIILILLSILFCGLFYIQVIKNNYYKTKLEEETTIKPNSLSTPRGRIYDRYGKLLVDNIAIKNLCYKKQDESKEEEIKKAYIISQNFDITYESVDDSILSIVSKVIQDKESLNETAYIYYLMNKGYYYDTKIIKSNLNENEYAKAGELSDITGLTVFIDWERKYMYDTLKSILGDVSTTSMGLTYELKDYYLSKGYDLYDRVGISGIEYQYNDILQGKKDIYSNNSIIKGSKGQDIYLTIDIDLQLKLDELIIETLKEGKKYPNTKYYDKSFVIISSPINGDILALSGKQLILSNGEYKINDCTEQIISTPIVVGSVVKGASHIVGYNEGAIKIGEVKYDTCLKFKGTNKKCSYSNLGYVSDIEALQKSSNVYQFLSAIKVGNGVYKYDGYLNIDNNALNIYRDTFKQFGLGSTTNIDFPNESIGYIGNDNMLLDFVIGQYDTYTVLQLSQYINTIANNGKRMGMHFLLKSNKEYNSILLNEVDTKIEYLSRVKEGFRNVITKGTGVNYTSSYNKFAGKTGTSESFINIDSKTIKTTTSTFVGYAPYDNPIMSIVVASPNVSNGSYLAPINSILTKKVTDLFFDLYK